MRIAISLRVLFLTSLMPGMLVVCYRGFADTSTDKTGVSALEPPLLSIESRLPGPNFVAIRPLRSDEGLEYETGITDEATGLMTLTVYASGRTKQRILVLSGHTLFDEPTHDGRATGMIKDGLNSKMKWMVIQVRTGRGPMDNDAAEIWLIDGRIGLAKKLLASTGFYFTVDDVGKTICVFDGETSFAKMIPTVVIYDIKTMKPIKTAQYEPLQNVNVSPLEMVFKNGAYYVTLGNDGPDWGVLKIPLKD